MTNPPIRPSTLYTDSIGQAPSLPHPPPPMYTFTFRRTRPGSMEQTVHVTAASSREAWERFEALYPFRHFTPYRISTVVE